MTKTTLKALRESLAIDQKAQGLGVVKGLADPVTVRDLKFFAKQVSNALQPTIPNLLAMIEMEANKYALTLGDIDMDEVFEDQGEEDFALLQFPDGEPVKNIILSLSWDKVSTASTFAYRPDKLEYSVKLSVAEVNPADFDAMVEGGDIDVEHDDVQNADEVFGDDDNDMMKEEASQKWKCKVSDGHTSRTWIGPAANAAEAQKKAVELFKKTSHIIVGAPKAGPATQVKESMEITTEENGDLTIVHEDTAITIPADLTESFFDKLSDFVIGTQE